MPYTLRVIQKTFLLVLHVTEISCVFAVAHIAARAQSYTNLLTFRKVKKSQLLKPQGQTLTGSGLYLSFLSKSDPLCGRHLVEQCDLTKQVYRERRLHAKQRPPPASIKFSAKQLWSSCSSSTCESSLTGNRQGQRMNSRTQNTILRSLHTPLIFRTLYLVSERS